MLFEIGTIAFNNFFCKFLYCI